MNPRLNAADQANVPIILAQSAVAVSCPVDTTEDVLASIPIIGGIVGPHGSLRLTTLWTFTNSANTKSLRARLGGIGGTDYFGNVITTQLSLRHQIQIFNRGAQNSQIGFTASTQAFVSTANAHITSAVDLSLATTLLITGQKQVGAEALTLESYLLELLSFGN